MNSHRSNQPGISLGLGLLLSFLSLVSLSPLLARRGVPPTSRSLAQPLGAVEQIVLPGVNREVLLRQDALQGKGIPPRFALPVSVEISPKNSGTWVDLAKGGRSWCIRFFAPSATDLNFGFTTYQMPPGATLHIISEREDYYEGPYTDEDNGTHKQLWTPVIPGDQALIELFVPAGPGDPELVLTQVGMGYRDLFKRDPQSRSGSCNIDVKCSEGDPWRDQIRSVATYSVSGFRICTGTMIMDVPATFRPFFLSAAHCGMNSANAPSMVVYWNFESLSCGDQGGGSLADNQTGASFLASQGDVDFALLELNEAPDPSFLVYHSGWDRTGNSPVGSVGIHHPNTDEKALAFNDDLLLVQPNCVSPVVAGTHWLVDNWETGTTEPGSSGSGLWDPATKKLVGFLTGGSSTCSFKGSDCYGRFSVAWNIGNSASSRLQDWLDPNDTGVSMVEGSDPAPQVFFVSEQISDICPSTPSNVNGTWEPGESVQLSVTIRGNDDFAGVQGTLTSSTAGVTIIDGVASWSDLVSGVNTKSNAPHFTVQLSEGFSCFTEANFNVQITSADGGPFNLPFKRLSGQPLSPNGPISIPDAGGAGSPAISTLQVSQDVALTDVDVQVDITHTWVGDLILTLRSPDGTEVTLLDRPGEPGTFFGCSNNNISVTFDDASDFDPENHCTGGSDNTWFTGTASPVGSLAAFNGKPTQGTWSLVVSDHEFFDTGTIVDWQLQTTPIIGGCSICVSAAESCALLTSGDWVIAKDCTLEVDATLPANVIVEAGTILTINDGVTLNMDFSKYHLRIKKDAKVVVKTGGRIR